MVILGKYKGMFNEIKYLHHWYILGAFRKLISSVLLLQKLAYQFYLKKTLKRLLMVHSQLIATDSTPNWFW